jgi:hypothetical protein
MPVSSAIITPVQAGGVVSPPGAALCTYRIRRGTDWLDLGGLRGVINDPTFSGSINQGAAPLQLTLDHYPRELVYGYMVEVFFPDGTVAGVWKYEQLSTIWSADKYTYQVTLMPFASELSDADFNANYSTDTTQPTTPLGPRPFSQPVLAGITRTMHCLVGTILDNGVSYSYVYNNARPVDALNQAITFGGSTWWWFCNSYGEVSLRNSSPFNHVVTLGREVTQGEWDEDIINLYNGYPVMGGTPSNALTALTAFAVDTNPANSYSVPNLGRRTAQPYSDTSLLDQASVNAVAASFLTYAEQVNRQQKFRLVGYYVKRPQPGDAITIRITSPDPTLGAGGQAGPFLITEVIEYGATHVYDLTVSATMAVPIAYFPPGIGQAQAVTKLAQNPPYVSVSPDGTTGIIGSGVANGSGGGVTYTPVPSVPTGLALTTGVDNVAQTNNAYIVATWNSPPTSDAVTGWVVNYHKVGDANYSHTWTNQTSTKISGLVPGTVYGFSVSAENSLGVYSANSSEVTTTAALDTFAPAKPTGLAAYRTPRGALVTWNGNTEADLAGYLLQVSVGGGGFQAVNTAPSLQNSAAYVAPSGTPQQTVLVFQVAAVDWTGNQSQWSTASANTPTDGTFFDEVMTGNLTATGTITGGAIQTSATGPRAVMDNAGVHLYDGSAVDYGSGVPGLTAELRSTDGSAFFSGTISASEIQSPPGVTPSASLSLTGVPALNFYDSNGIPRATIGQFTSNADASTQYGLQVLDPTGSLLFDTVVGMCANNHFGQYSGGPFTTSSTSSVPIGPTIAFSLPYRAQNVYVNIKGYLEFGYTGAYAGQTWQIAASINGGASSSIAIPGAYNTGGNSLALPFNFLHTFYQVPVGSYTGTIVAYVTGTAILTLIACSVDVFLLGGPNAGN